jgi:hypothetical protein
MLKNLNAFALKNILTKTFEDFIMAKLGGVYVSLDFFSLLYFHCGLYSRTQ